LVQIARNLLLLVVLLPSQLATLPSISLHLLPH
jgi:hypothetical protein